METAGSSENLNGLFRLFLRIQVWQVAGLRLGGFWSLKCMRKMWRGRVKIYIFSFVFLLLAFRAKL
jgi:hypothetical protein